MADASDALLDRLTRLHPKVIDLSLDRLRVLLADLGNPERSIAPVIHIAGTNGKGSTQAMIRAGLEAAGKQVHAYTSPHLAQFHERIRLAGALIAEANLAATLEECEAANGGAPITFFEITTAGHDRHSVCRQHHEFSVKALEGTLPQETADPWFAFIATIDAGEDWTDPKVWPKANPSLGVTVKIDDLKRQIDEAREMPAQQNAIRRLRLNEWTEQVTRWLDMQVWAEGGLAPETSGATIAADLERLEGLLVGRECYGGLDLARQLVSEGKKVAILSLGTRLHEALKAADELDAKGLSTTVADMRFAKPLDEALIRKLCATHEVVLTIEEGAIGGLGAHGVQLLRFAGAAPIIAIDPLEAGAAVDPGGATPDEDVGDALGLDEGLEDRPGAVDVGAHSLTETSHPHLAGGGGGGVVEGVLQAHAAGHHGLHRGAGDGLAVEVERLRFVRRRVQWDDVVVHREAPSPWWAARRSDQRRAFLL